MKLFIACITGDSFVNMYAGKTKDEMYEKTAKGHVRVYAAEASDPDAVRKSLNKGYWANAVEEYFDGHDSETLYIGDDEL